MKFKGEQRSNAFSKFGSQGYTKRSQGAIVSGAGKLQAKLEQANISSFNTSSSRDYFYRGRVEIDTRADTMCAGASFEKHEAKGKIVDVKGF